MLNLPRRDLPVETAVALQALQDAVCAGQNFEDRVAKGKLLFQRRNKRNDRVFSVIRGILADISSNVLRCCYCELSEIDQVEHVAPKDLFPELCFVWENYLYACGPCNRTKLNRWWILDSENGQPREVTRGRGGPVETPPGGAPLMLNPRVDDPLEFLFLDTLDTFEFMPAMDAGIGKLRAEKTIEMLSLNREAVRVARETAFGTYREILGRYVDEKKGAGPRRYSGAPAGGVAATAASIRLGIYEAAEEDAPRVASAIGLGA
jgi:hypothetical protein